MNLATKVEPSRRPTNPRLGTTAAFLEKALAGMTALLALIFLATAFLYLSLGHWSVTHLDFCRLYAICLTHSWLGSALPKFNNHSLFFPSFVWLTDLRFLHGNQQFVFWCGIALLIITFLALTGAVIRDAALSRSGKIAGLTILVAANFWLGRAEIIVSGGFNCIASLSMLTSVVALLFLPRMLSDSNRLWPAFTIVLMAGFVASFSYSSGLAIWPALLVVGWCCRLRPRLLFLLGAGGLVAAIIYVQLPDPSATFVNLRGSFSPTAALGALAIERLCRLVGSPIAFALSAWRHSLDSGQANESSRFSLVCGAIGLAFSVASILLCLMRRDLKTSGASYIGFALVLTNLLVLIIVVIGRASLIHSLPSEIAAPRYFFWSTLFWAGLFLMAIRLADSNLWARPTALVGTVILLIFLFPKHKEEGMRCRYAASLAQRASTSLINGVRDPQAVKILFADPEQVYRVGETLRAKRLDMFADDLQDWISKPAAELFQGKGDPASLKANCRLDAYLRCDDGEPAARVSGWLVNRDGTVPSTLVITDSRGVICGIARSFSTGDLMNRVFYSHKLPRAHFVGYIRHYNAATKYAVRSTDGGRLSQQSAPIPPANGDIPLL